MENQIIDESENWNSAGALNTYKDIVMSQVNRVVRNMSQEMRNGFWIRSTSTPNIESQKLKYIGSSKEELINSLNVLHDLLLPRFDEDMKKKVKEIDEETKKLVEKKEEHLVFIKHKLKIYRKLFQEISKLLERLGWFESGDIED